MPARVVLLSAFATPMRSGAEACSEEISRALGDRYNITIVTARMRRSLPRRETLPGDVKLRRIGLGFPIDKWLFPFLAPFTVWRLHPQIIHAVLESFAGLTLVFCRFLCPRAKRILTCQSTNTTFLVGFMHRFPHRLTAISSTLVERAERFGRKDVIQIPNGLNLRDIPKMTKVQGRVLFVGRLESMKGVDTLLKAFAAMGPLIRERAVLRIIGEGSLRPELEALVKELKIADRVTFLGYIPSPAVYREFAQAEIFCGLSRSEALGNVFIEAQAAGCAVIATRIQGIPDIVKDGATGILVPVDDIPKAKDALERLIIDSTLRMKIAQAGRFSAQDYDWATIAEQYAEVYEGILA
ncbi:MAG: glycosyltransferase family 4 protein [Candidatus Peregrinibacteria bacterium]|nr:glycosyltransferase family 4 protein [Candidatus Peregrinibacteria bacterium]